MSERMIDCGDGVVKCRTCAWSPPGDHPVGCGMYLTVKDGKVVDVEGDADHPITQGRLCVRCLTLPEYMYNEKRVLHPLKRDPKDRGKDAWEEITWDEALDIIEERVNYVKQNWGAESIVAFQGTGREATLYKTPLAYAALGTPNSCFPMSGDSCYGPRCSVADFILGAGYPELDYAAFFPDRFDDPRYEVPKYIVLWGKDPLLSNPDGFFGHTLIDLMKRGSRLHRRRSRASPGWPPMRTTTCSCAPAPTPRMGLGMINLVIQRRPVRPRLRARTGCYGFDDLAESVRPSTRWTRWRRSPGCPPRPSAARHARGGHQRIPRRSCGALPSTRTPNGVQAGHCAAHYLAAILRRPGRAGRRDAGSCPLRASWARWTLRMRPCSSCLPACWRSRSPTRSARAFRLRRSPHRAPRSRS